ncbi:ABC transporter permease, partial [Fervidobacterium sp.]
LKGVDVFGYLQYILVHVPIASAILVLLAITVISLSKSTTKIFVFEQIFFQVQMFVGGFYFPLKFANPVVKTVAKMLPLTYTVDALRIPKNLNALESGHIVVPLIYIVILSLIVAFSGKKLKIGE